MRALAALALLSSCFVSTPRYVCRPLAANAWVSYCRDDYREWTCIHYLDGRIDCSYPTPIRRSP